MCRDRHVTCCNGYQDFLVSVARSPTQIGVSEENLWVCVVEKLQGNEGINRVVLYSTGNYIQSPGINHNGKEYKKRMYITESLCYIAEINTL